MASPLCNNRDELNDPLSPFLLFLPFYTPTDRKVLDPANTTHRAPSTLRCTTFVKPQELLSTVLPQHNFCSNNVEERFIEMDSHTPDLSDDFDFDSFLNFPAEEEPHMAGAADL